MFLVVMTQVFSSQLLGPVFGRTDFSRTIFWAAGFLHGFCRRIFSSFLWGKVPRKSSRKIPGKILQNLHNKIPGTFLQRGWANSCHALKAVSTPSLNFGVATRQQAVSSPQPPLPSKKVLRSMPPVYNGNAVSRRPHSNYPKVLQGKCPLHFLNFNGVVCSNTLFSNTFREKLKGNN